MSISAPESVGAQCAVPDERDEGDVRTIELLDVSRGRVSRLDDFPWTSELPAINLEVTRPVEGSDRAAESPSLSGFCPEVPSWRPVLRTLAVVATALLVGVITGPDSFRDVEAGVAESLVVGPLEVNGAVREVAGEIVVPVVVPLYNGGTAQIDVLSARPDGWRLDEAAGGQRVWTVHPGHWRSIPISLTVDCRAVPPRTTLLSVPVRTASGDETITVAMPADTRSLVGTWQSRCDMSKHRPVVP